MTGKWLRNTSTPSWKFLGPNTHQTPRIWSWLNAYYSRNIQV